MGGCGNGRSSLTIPIHAIDVSRCNSLQSYNGISHPSFLLNLAGSPAAIREMGKCSSGQPYATHFKPFHIGEGGPHFTSQSTGSGAGAPIECGAMGWNFVLHLDFGGATTMAGAKPAAGGQGNCLLNHPLLLDDVPL